MERAEGGAPPAGHTAGEGEGGARRCSKRRPTRTPLRPTVGRPRSSRYRRRSSTSRFSERRAARRSESLSWLRQPCFVAYRKVARISLSRYSWGLGYANLTSKLIAKLLEYPSLFILGALATPALLRSLTQNCSNIPQNFKISHKRLVQSKFWLN